MPVMMLNKIGDRTLIHSYNFRTAKVIFFMYPYVIILINLSGKVRPAIQRDKFIDRFLYSYKATA